MTQKKLILIWFALLVMLGVSLALGRSGHRQLATILIFGVATLKAFLVGAFYMRLRWEPGYIVCILLGGIGLILILYFALVPDIVYVYGQ